VCGTNISLPGNAVDASDHIEITCNVSFNGIWIPVFVCSPELTRITTNQTNQTSPNLILYRHVIAASDIEDFAVFNCSMTFTLSTDYRTMCSEIPVKPEIPVSHFVWKTSAIRIVNASGKYIHCIDRRICLNSIQYLNIVV